jgi:hypothetical protein
MTESKSYNGLLGLDNLSKWAKTVIWLVTFVVVTGASILATLMSLIAFRYSNSISGYIIYIIAPALGIYCLAGVGLRLVGIHWPYIFAFWLATIVLSIPITFFLWMSASFALSG